jgi:hypothetical protein
MIPGRSCPLSYRYDPLVFRRAPDIYADTLYVVGGLYGNEQALEAITDMHAREPDATLVFNGDFNWFNAERASFERINRHVLAHRAMRGNVETELVTADDAAGCGCAYPQWVGDAEVERSNQIMERLRSIAQPLPQIAQALQALPINLVAEVGEIRVALVHGDLESLAGWDLAQEHVDDEVRRSRIVRQMDRAKVRIVASSHTCLPVALGLSIAGRDGAVLNNGAAGMPNFKNRLYGVITRISVRPASHVDPLYTLRVDGLYCEALAVFYDQVRFLQAFERCWVPASPAYLSYYRRIAEGPDYTVAQVLRGSAQSSG